MNKYTVYMYYIYIYIHQTYFWTLQTRPWDFGGLSAKIRTGGGNLVSGMITTLFRGHAEQYLHTPARAHHTLLQKQTLRRRGLGFRGVGEPFHVQPALFLMFIRCCAPGFRSFKPSWQHLRSAWYLQLFRTIRPPVVQQFLPRRV